MDPRLVRDGEWWWWMIEIFTMTNKFLFKSQTNKHNLLSCSLEKIKRAVVHQHCEHYCALRDCFTPPLLVLYRFILMCSRFVISSLPSHVYHSSSLMENAIDYWIMTPFRPSISIAIQRDTFVGKTNYSTDLLGTWEKNTFNKSATIHWVLKPKNHL